VPVAFWVALVIMVSGTKTLSLRDFFFYSKQNVRCLHSPSLLVSIKFIPAFCILNFTKKPIEHSILHHCITVFQNKPCRVTSSGGYSADHWTFFIKNILHVSLRPHAIATLNSVGRPKSPLQATATSYQLHFATRQRHTLSNVITIPALRQSTTVKKWKFPPTHPRSQS
jgi:hypothetical protein